MVKTPFVCMCFSKINTTITTQSVNNLKSNYLSVAIRPFFYYHILPFYCHKTVKNMEFTMRKRIFSAKKMRSFSKKYNVFNDKHKKRRKKLAFRHIFCIFATSKKSSCQFNLVAHDSCVYCFKVTFRKSARVHEDSCP